MTVLVIAETHVDHIHMSAMIAMESLQPAMESWKLAVEVAKPRAIRARSQSHVPIWCYDAPIR
eukprot:CAMPEP_0195150822 /NCGR_PEP_ID=MMETSP0448-20130528/179523_1 /TAXON_ID=66468 /ORGANISM="Heterocapsa triquestra, Strain CCMP 448" /LENGTH=62 /DNA_ID=CAMNT_0040189517 /DNA_START=54 /DNA_END=239 /DNA_ORIENTATION=-